MRPYIDKILEIIASVLFILLIGAFGLLTGVFLLIMILIITPFILFDYWKNDLDYRHKR